MKTLATLLFFLSFSFISIQAQDPLLPFILADYDFSNNATDNSTNGFHGIVYGAILTSNQYEQENMAYDFDGIDDYILVPNALNLGTGDFSIELWFNTNSFLPIPPAARPISKGVTVYGSPAYAGYAIQIHEMNGAHELRFMLGDASGVTTSTISSGIPQNEWVHVVAIREGTEMRLFLDADLSAITNTSIVYNVDTDVPFAIGTQLRNAQNPLSFFDGKIAVCRLYNKALTAEDVYYLYYYQNETVQSVEPQQAPFPFVVYPTVLKHGFNMVLNEEQSKTKTGLQVFNQSGQLVDQATMEAGTKMKEWNCANWQSGLYILKVTQGQTAYTTKLVKIAIP